MPEPFRRSLEAARRNRRAECSTQPQAAARTRLSSLALALVLRAWLQETTDA